MQHVRSSRTGFTLVELSIVLVIIGLLVGGVMAGNSLLNQSKLQSAIANYTTYAAATAQFKQQYGGLPGDLLDATNYWGDDAAVCPDAAVTDGTPGTCNGDGNNIIYGSTVEALRAWQHLQLAKLITGTFTGYPTAAIGGTLPASRIRGAGWSFSYNTDVLGGADWYNQNLNNFLAFGSSCFGGTYCGGITPSEAFWVDKKIDDGIPSTGRVITMKPSPSPYTPYCTTSAVDASAAYNLSYASKACSLMMSLTGK